MSKSWTISSDKSAFRTGTFSFSIMKIKDGLCIEYDTKDFDQKSMTILNREVMFSLDSVDRCYKGVVDFVRSKHPEVPEDYAFFKKVMSDLMEMHRKSVQERRASDS